MNMYLTDKRKAEHLALLADCRAAGDVEPGVDKYLNLINKYPGIVTVESCEGHEKGETPGFGFVILLCTNEFDPKFERRVVPPLLTVGASVRKDFDSRKLEAAYWIWFPIAKRDAVFASLIGGLRMSQ